MKGLAVVVLTIFVWIYVIRFLPWFAEKFIDWFYSHTEGQRTEIEIQISVSIVVLCVMVLLFG